MPENLLHRADAAARQAAELSVEWFWLRLEMLQQRAERLASAEERRALAAHRTGHLFRRQPQMSIVSHSAWQPPLMRIA